MAKSREAFRTISEVSDTLDTPTHVLRFWESKFSQIKPVKRAGGRRYYRPEDIDLLAGIKTLLHEHGMTIKGAQKLLREQGVKHIAGLASDVDGAPEQSQVSPIAVETTAPEVTVPADQNVAQEPAMVAKAEPAAVVDGAPKAPARTMILAEVAAPNQLMVKANAAKISALLIKLETLRDAMRAA